MSERSKAKPLILEFFVSFPLQNAIPKRRPSVYSFTMTSASSNFAFGFSAHNEARASSQACFRETPLELKNGGGDSDLGGCRDPLDVGSVCSKLAVLGLLASPWVLSLACSGEECVPVDPGR